MKNLLIYIMLFNILINAYSEEIVTLNGEVEVSKIKATTIYRINGISIARGSVKHVKKHVGNEVSINCVIKKNRIVRIKSVYLTKLGNPKELKTHLDISRLERTYLSEPSKTITNYRNKSMIFSGLATGIRNYTAAEYQVNILNGKGKIIIPKAKLPQDIRKKLWSSKGYSMNVEFKGKWVSNEANSFLFKEIDYIKTTY